MLYELRIQQLEDHIRQDQDLLKEYEDELRYETEPRRVMRYRREIKRQEESLMHYEQEYRELQNNINIELPLEKENTEDRMQQIGTDIQQMGMKIRQIDTKIDQIYEGQEDIKIELTDLRKSLLARFDTNEQVIVSTLIDQLNQTQLPIMQDMIDIIEADRIPESELHETLETVYQALSEMKSKEAECYNSQLRAGVESLSEIIDDPKLDVNNKLKVSLPIIPLIISYETEIQLTSGVNLKAAWKGLKDRVRGN